MYSFLICALGDLLPVDYQMPMLVLHLSAIRSKKTYLYPDLQLRARSGSWSTGDSLIVER
ncbi:hypothetical protein SAMN05216286_3336 [Kosakonia oryzae]|uniref:Uncharacterized protein n=1 Tax=Kosakonia oryzae TaxID=497725 RepID=A0AA94H5L3_9ENTR|nr:hypothetical protein SAMN05216286_3336 [Kosakonia oryzae]